MEESWTLLIQKKLCHWYDMSCPKNLG